MSFHYRPKLQASRNNNRRFYPPKNDVPLQPRQGMKRAFDSEELGDCKKLKSNVEETITKSNNVTPTKYSANDRLKNLRKQITPEVGRKNKSPEVPDSLYSIQNVVTPGGSKNTADNRLKKLQTNLQSDSGGSSNSQKVTANDFVYKNVDHIDNHTTTHNYTKQSSLNKSISDRLKVTPSKGKPLGADSKASINKVGDRLKVAPSTSNAEVVDHIDLTNSPFSRNDVCTGTNAGNPSTHVDSTASIDTSVPFNPKPVQEIESPVKLEQKVNKFGFTYEWITQTNFDGDTSSMMEVSTQARANDTVANIEAIQNDVVEMEWTSEVNAKKMFSGQSVKSHDVCIIVDTNVFIDNLNKIKDVIKIKVSGATIPIIYVPWMVITELDFIKDTTRDLKLKRLAYNAVKYINTLLTEKHPRLIGQTVFDVDKQKQIGQSPDDKIISCALQAAETYEFVFILSNDINLKNKAMIHNITACSPNDIIIRIMGKLNKADKVQRVISQMGMLCTFVIVDSVKDCYGNVWTRMDMLSADQPWPFQKCLKIFKRYWVAVFKDKILKQFMKSVDETLTFFKNVNHICDDSKEYIDLIKLCVTICIFLKDLKTHRDKVEKTISEITNIS